MSTVQILYAENRNVRASRGISIALVIHLLDPFLQVSIFCLDMLLYRKLELGR